MSPVVPDAPWVRAFDAAAGRAIGAGLPDDLAGLASRLVALGRVIAQEEACPTRWVRKAETLFRPPARVGARLLSLVLDTWSASPSAVRGGGGRRYVRLSDEGARLDAEIGEASSDGVSVRGTVEGLASGATVVACAGRREAARADVREGGVFELVLPREVAAFRLDVRLGRRTLARTPELSTRPPGGSAPPAPARPRRRSP